MGYGSSSSNASSVTESGISAGKVTIKDDAAQQTKTGKTATETIASINTKVTEKDSSGKLSKDWNGQQLMEDVTAQAQIMQSFGSQAARAIGDYALKKENDIRGKLEKETDPQKQAELNTELKSWEEGGSNRVLLHTAAGALSGDLGGALGAATSAISMPQINKEIAQMELPEQVQKGLEQVTATALGAIVGGNTGAAMSLNVEANNRQLHQSEYDMAKKNAKLIAKKLGISEVEAEGRIVAELQRNSDKQTAEASGGKHDYEIRRLVGCKLLNCDGYKNDPQYANNDFNKQFIAPNQAAYDSGQAHLDTGLTDQELRNKNIVSERIGKTVLAGTACVLAGPTACKAASTGLATTLGINYLLDKPVTTAESLGGIYGGILGGIYAQTLAQWASGTSSFAQSATLLITKQGSIYGGKQVGVSVGNNTFFGGSVDPLFDPAINPVWGRTNTYNYFFGDKK